MRSADLLLCAGLGAVALLGGCKGDKDCDTATEDCDTGSSEEQDPYEGLTYVERVSWDCEADRYWYDVYTVGWTGGAELSIVDPGDGTSVAWTETHSLAHWANDEYGYWEEMYLELSILGEPECSLDPGGENPCWQVQESGVNTLPQCDQETKARLSLSVSILDADDPTVQADCVAWGADPGQFAGCTAFDAE